MYIHLIVNHSGDRLKWQYEISQLETPIDFSIGITVQHVEHFQTSALSPGDVVVVVVNEPTQINHLKTLKGLINENFHVLVLIKESFEMAYGKLTVMNLLSEAHPYLDAFLFETEFTKENLYQCLFKPQKLKFGVWEASISEETVLIPSTEREPLLPLFRSRMKPRKPIEMLSKRAEKLPRQRICVHGQGALAYELGAVLSSDYNQSVLIMDIDRTMPTADIYCGVKPVVTEKYDFYSKATATGLNILLDCMKKRELGREAFQLCTQKVKGFPELQVLTGVYKMEDYEYYKSDDLKRLLHSASQYYDVVILRTNSFPYDGFTLNSFLYADLVLCGVKPSIESVRYNRQLIQLMAAKQNISVTRQLWVLFESPKMPSLEKKFLIEMGMGTYCGSVPFDGHRDKCQRIGEAYLHKQRQALQVVYQPIIKAIYSGGCV